MALFIRKNLKNLNNDPIYELKYHVDEEYYRIVCEIAVSTIGFVIVPDVSVNDSVIYDNYKCDGTIQQKEHK